MHQHHIEGCLSLASGNMSDCKCASEKKRYVTLSLISAVTFMVEAVGGVITGSLSLLSDAIHVLLDMFESAMNAYIAGRVLEEREAKRIPEATLRKIGANISAVLIFLASLLILHEAIERLGTPPGLLMVPAMAIGLAGLVVNLVQGYIHVHAPDEHHNMTYSWQLIHIASDAAGSLLVVVGVGLTYLGYQWGDVVATFVIVLLIWGRVGYHVLTLLRKEQHEHGHSHEHHHH